MCNIQELDYKGQKIRTTLIDGERWWSLHDVSIAAETTTKYYAYSKKLNDNEKKIVVITHSNKRGGAKYIFVNESALYNFLNRSYNPKAVEFQKWLETEIGLDFSSIQIKEKLNSSIQASLQKAQMLIRIAENKAVPHSEQLRLLDMAAKILTGTGFNTDEVLKAKQSIEKDAHRDIMDLPEVVGFIREKETKSVNGCLVDFLPAEMMAIKWRSPNEKFNGKDFNELANEDGYKTSQFGFWQRVMTPQGEAREFMYIDGTLLDYVNKKRNRVA